MVIFDSNIWIAVFNDEDSTHSRATKIFYSYAGESVYVTDYIVLEVTSVLKNMKKFHLAIEFLNTIQREQIPVIFGEKIFTQTVSNFKSFDKNNLSFVDLSLLSLAKRGYKIETLDTALKRKLKALA